ncbi:carboxypeptidase-like regulatory domain-containing protein [Ekhidna sp.]
MKKPIILILICLGLIFLESCKCEGPGGEEPIVLAKGQVFDYDKNPIESAKIKVNYDSNNGESKVATGVTDANGNFSIELPRSNRYVINISKVGYSFTSTSFQNDKTVFDSIPESVFYLNQATVETIDPTVGGTVTVTNTQSFGSNSSRADWTQSPTGSLPIVLDDSGRVASFRMPDQLKQAWDIQVKNEARLSATRLRLRPNTLVNAQGNAPQGNVSVSVSAIDVFAPNGMPGRNIARTAREQTGPMQSFGALAVEIYDNDQSYNLNSNQDASAEIVMPIPDWQLELAEDFPKSVPIVFYNEETGVWEEDGRAFLNDSLKAYVGQISHFSSINFDIIKTGPSANAAFRFNNTTPAGSNELIFPFQVELTTEDAVSNQLFVRTRTIDLVNGGNDILLVGEFGGGSIKQYGISMNRLPINSPVAVTFFNNAPNPDANALFVLQTNGGSTDITMDPWGTPDSTEFVTNVYSESRFVAPDLFTDINTGTQGDTLVAMCLNGAGTHYRISFAARDLGFDAATPGGGLALTFNDNSGCLTGNIFVTGNPDFNELFKTVTGPPEDPEWMVQVYEVPITSICSDASITSYTVTIAKQSDPGLSLFTYNTDVGSCVFAP